MIKREDLTEEEYAGIECSVDVAIDEHGWQKDDGSWLTYEEFGEWSEDQIVEAYNLIYGD